MISIYGTSHISEKIVNQIKTIIDKEKPDLIAIELDELRLKALLGEKGLKKSRTPIFFLMERVQKYFGKKVNIIPGREMLEAYNQAKIRKIPMALIDQDIGITVLKFKRIPAREKIKIVFALLSIFVPFNSKKNLQLDLKEVPSQKLIDMVLKEFKKFLPQFYKVLISDRNKLMVQKLKLLETEFEKILVFVGAGHVKGMKTLLEN